MQVAPVVVTNVSRPACTTPSAPGVRLIQSPPWPISVARPMMVVWLLPLPPRTSASPCTVSTLLQPSCVMVSRPQLSIVSLCMSTSLVLPAAVVIPLAPLWSVSVRVSPPDPPVMACRAPACTVRCPAPPTMAMLLRTAWTVLSCVPPW